jgi:hypothetical protein
MRIQTKKEGEQLTEQKKIMIGKHSISYGQSTEKITKRFTKWLFPTILYSVFYLGYLEIYKNKGFEFSMISLLYFTMVSIWIMTGKISDVKKEIEGLNGNRSQ